MKKPANTPSITLAIGEIVKSIRLDHGINQTELSHHLGLDQSAMSRVESGKQILTATQWVQLCLHVQRHDTLTLRVKGRLGL